MRNHSENESAKNVIFHDGHQLYLSCPRRALLLRDKGLPRVTEL